MLSCYAGHEGTLSGQIVIAPVINDLFDVVAFIVLLRCNSSLITLRNPSPLLFFPSKMASAHNFKSFTHDLR